MLYLLSAAQNDSIWWDGAQLEQKSFATSWHNPADGARANEILSAPTVGILSPTQGTISHRVLVNDTSKRQEAGVYPYIFRVGTDEIAIVHNHNTAEWRAWLNGGTSNIVVADSYTPNGEHTFTVSWSASAFKFYIDDILRGTVSSPSLPGSFSTPMYIGSSGTAHFLNAVFGNWQGWTYQLSDAEVAAHVAQTAARPHPASRAFFTFDETLVNGVLLSPAILQEFTQLQSRYQKLTLSNCLVAPQCSIGYWGEGKELDYVDRSFDPKGIERKANINMSETRYMSGVHEKYTERSMTLAWEDAEDALYQILADWAETIGLLNFIIGWELESHPDEIYLMHADPKFINPFTRGGAYRDIVIKLLGRKL